MPKAKDANGYRRRVCGRVRIGRREKLEPMRFPQDTKRLHALPAGGGCAVPCCSIATSLSEPHWACAKWHQ
eukprot:3809304-Pyramimonas_sp.AAC.1